MKVRNVCRAWVLIQCLIWTLTAVAAEPLDERSAEPGEWGYRPADASVALVNPPSFSWRPQANVVSWQLECRRTNGSGSIDGNSDAIDSDNIESDNIEYQADDVAMTVHCPPRTFPAGAYTWRYRGKMRSGELTAWSASREFNIRPDAVAMPLPPRAELLARIPRSHPRLFIRPEDLPRLRELARGAMREEFEGLVARCEALVADPPPTEEPPKYAAGTVRGSDEWRAVWWGNRTYTINTLDSAATLAFTRLLGGKEEYGQLAKRILLDCAEWDPHGATGYLYNDEAGMPYNYYFVRTYTFVHDLLSEEDRQLCRRVMKSRGDEMYRHLYPRHLWQPYSSHSNRAWHFLGEVGIAMLDEVEGADQWVWFAMNVFHNVYPVWSDEDGGWHEGFGYWNSYLGRFTWWADVMRSAVGVNAFDKPYFSQIGYYPMYLLPPGKVGAGFGDLNAPRKAADAVPLVSQLATQAGNGHWQWYVDQMGGSQNVGGYIGFVRGALPAVESLAPDDLPTSRHFRGIGQAVLNTTLQNAADAVQVVFKSSPFGTQSHGYEANNSFLLWAYGQRLLIRSGYRDSYGSDHHRQWMWSTRSVNNITVDGQGQQAHSAAAVGKITAFQTSPTLDIVCGEAADAYRSASGQPLLDRFTRTILFVKPELVVVYDQLNAREASKFEYRLHATHEFAISAQDDIRLDVDDVRCDISILAPEGLQFTQTDQYDPNPRPRIALREWHLTAATPEKSKSVEFVTLYRPQRVAEHASLAHELTRVDGGFLLRAELSDGELTALLPMDESATMSAAGLSTGQGKIFIQRRNVVGEVVERASFDKNDRE